MRRRPEHASKGRSGIRDASRQGSYPRRVAQRPRQPEMERVRRDDWSEGLTQIGEPPGDGQQRQVVVDDDHSARTQIWIVTAERSRSLRDTRRDIHEEFVQISVVAFEV